LSFNKNGTENDQNQWLSRYFLIIANNKQVLYNIFIGKNISYIKKA
jgi:hypothetical protein